MNCKKLQRLILVRISTRNFAKRLLKELEVLKLYLMKKYEITHEEEYCIRDEIYQKNKYKAEKNKI